MISALVQLPNCGDSDHLDGEQPITGQAGILTDAGQILVRDVRQGLKLLADAFETARARPRRSHPRQALNVSVLPSLAARWLVPRA